MIILVSLVPIAILGFLLFWEKSDRARERAEWTAERDKLCQRIQAPERAMIDEFEPSEAVQYVPFDDDVAFQRNREELSGG